MNFICMHRDLPVAIISQLIYINYRCQLIDFHKPTGPDGTHPELFHWVSEYFQKQEDFKPPLYLQHQGNQAC